MSCLVLRAYAADLPDHAAMLREAQRRVAVFHQGAAREGVVLRLVYFHPADRGPLPKWRERLGRVMEDVSGFYRDETRRYGLQCDGIPLERVDGQLVFHVVRGSKPAGGYRHESGDETAAEIRRALRGKVDPDREFLLVFYGLTHQEPDGRYVFNAPYYGSWTCGGGLAHVADCELLDPLQLTNKRQSMVITEHAYPRKELTVAKFNSMYLGGVAHELGHALGLPHDAGSPAERRGAGVSLMGNGNLNYRADRWGGKDRTYLSAASALRLVSSAAFTRSNRDRWSEADGRVKELDASAHGPQLRLKGRVAAKVEAYGVVVTMCPYMADGKLSDEHDSITFPGSVVDGGFDLGIDGLKGGAYRLILSVLQVNGAAVDFPFRLNVDAAGRPDAIGLKEVWLISAAEAAIMSGEAEARAWVSDAAIARAPTEEARRSLRILRRVLDPPALIDLAATAAKSVFLSDAVWSSARVGWGKPARNHYWFDDSIRDGLLLGLGGRVYEKALYAHSSSRYVFALGRRWKTFSARVGLRDGAHERGSAVFIVRGDGRELYRSPMLRVGAQARVNVDVANVEQLELIAEGGEGHNFHSWAIWVEPQIARE
jgi:hypothetical protein